MAASAAAPPPIVSNHRVSASLNSGSDAAALNCACHKSSTRLAKASKSGGSVMGASIAGGA